MADEEDVKELPNTSDSTPAETQKEATESQSPIEVNDEEETTEEEPPVTVNTTTLAPEPVVEEPEVTTTTTTTAAPEATVQPDNTESKENNIVEEPKPVTTETTVAPAPAATTPETTAAPVVTTETTAAPAPEPATPVEEKNTTTVEEPKKENAIIEEMANIIKKLDDKLTKVSDRLEDFEGKVSVEVPAVSPSDETPQEGTGSRKSVAVASQTEPESRPAIETPEPEAQEDPQGENTVDPSEIIAQFTSAYREVYPQLNADDRTNYTTALRHLNQGEGTEQDTKVITSILRRF